MPVNVPLQCGLYHYIANGATLEPHMYRARGDSNSIPDIKRYIEEKLSAVQVLKVEEVPANENLNEENEDFRIILGLQEKASQVVFDDRTSVLHFPQPHVVPRQYYSVSSPPDSQQFAPIFFNIGLILISIDPVCNQVLSDLDQMVHELCLLNKQGFRLTDKTETVPKEVPKNESNLTFIFSLKKAK